MKLQLSFIPYLVLFMFLTNHSEAQLNLSQKVQYPTIGLDYPNADFSFRGKLQDTLFSSFTLPNKKPPKYDYQFSNTNTNFFPDPSLNNLIFSQNKNQNMFSNRRLKYSSLWAFTSLNYLYADLVGLMDVNLLSQYQTGIVNGVEITPPFLTAAAAYMQLPLSNVFLPHVIKNDKALRWVQIISGSIATLVQGATLFVGEPSPYYILFSVIEIGATAYITIDAIKWKVGKNKKTKSKNFF
jgi:hypothetical protein